MSTRAQIAFYGEIEQPLKKWDALIYKHNDGDPESMLPELEVFCTDFNAKRGLYDSEYAAAWYLMFLFKQHLKIAEGFQQDHTMREVSEPSKAFPELKDFGLYRGYGVSKAFHGDLSYLYAVYPDRIEAYEVIRDPAAFGDASHMRTLEGFTLNLQEVIKIK